MRTTALLFALALLVSAAVPDSPAHAAAGDEVKPIRALLITGGCCHDYINQKKILTEGISARANVHWTIVHQGGTTTNNKIGLHENENWADGFDVIVHNECFAGVTDKDFVQRVLKPHKAGKPAVVIHCAMHNYRDKTDEWFKFIGITSHGHGSHYAIDVEKIKTEKEHPIMEGFPAKWTTKKGELYFSHKVWDTATPLGHAMSRESKKHEVCIWVNDYNKGTRVFGTTIGHYNEEMSDPVFLTYVTRGLLWSVDKLNADYLKPASKDLKTIDIDPFGPDGKSPRPADAPLTPGQKKPAASVKPGTKVPVNLALGKKATAPRSQDGHDPSHAVDGDADTRWCAHDWNTLYTWQVDLGKVQEITGINIAWESDDAPYGYKIDASDDGATWRGIIDTTEKPVTGPLHQHKADIKTRHLRLTVTKLKAGRWGSFWEFEVLGKEMIDAGKPGASSIISLDRPAAAGEGLLGQVKIAPGYKVTMFAQPPQINYPTVIAAAPTGEVFIGIDENGSLGKDGKRAMKVIRAVDNDNDGKADAFTTFCNINNPRGLFFHDGTLFVLGPPNLRAFTDTNGDGVADTDKLLVKGLGSPALAQRGADHCTNGFAVGIDGWFYIAVGDFGAIKAEGSDGKSVQLHGGGIIRVRPDGSEIEIVTRGQRNIYDVAIDPLLNMFTRDNTNDGDGWNVRLSHIIQGGQYGYPSLFKNFPEDIIQPLADYGGGSPTGALFIDEGALTGDAASGLLTCDWGRSVIYRHPLTADGAGFKAQQQSFIELPRPTDMDVDGSGRIFVASWREGGFSYAKPDVGYVVRVVADGAKTPAFANLRKAGDSELIGFIGSASHKLRLHAQWEILRRGDSPAIATGLRELAAKSGPLAPRVAAIFTLKQLRGTKSNDALVALTKDAAVREFALRALADRATEVADVPPAPFVEAVKDANPRVRLQAATGLSRLGRTDAAGALPPLLADADPLVRHTAVHALVTLRAAQPALAALDKHDGTLAAGALQVLRSLHDTHVVDALVQHLKATTGGEEKKLIITALARLYHTEGDWKGDWWGTRPDTRGPYYNPVTWDGSARIAPVLLAALSNGDAAMSKFIINEMARHRIKLDDATGHLVRMARADASLVPALISVLQESDKLPADAIAMLESTAKNKTIDAELRGSAAGILASASDQPGVFDAAISALVAVGNAGKASEAISRARESFATDRRHAKNVNTFVKMTADPDAGRREAAFAVLISIANARQSATPAKEAAARAISAGWSSADVVPLLRAVAMLKADAYKEQVTAHLGDSKADVRQIAAHAARQLKIDITASEDPNKVTLTKLGYDKVLAAALTGQGDGRLGKELFAKQGCVQCHTVSQAEALKGPLLLGIGQRYSRAELIEAILKPSAKVSQGFETQWFMMDDGLNYEGFVTRESADEVEMRNVTGAVTVLKKAEIEERGKRETSMMPTGLADKLDLREFVSVLAYLESLKAD